MYSGRTLMRALIEVLRYAALFVCLALLGGCDKNKVLVLVADNHPTISLFGFEESELHHIHNTVELHRNIFLVRYDPERPDALEWINCPIPATYQYQQARGRRVESMYIKSFQELQAKVPVNYARFAGYVKNGKQLEFKYVTIGSYELLSDFKIPRNDADCARATHYVVTLSVGAFNFSEQQAIEGGVEASEAKTGVGVGVSAGRGSGETTSMGDLDDCMDEQAALNGCFTPLQLMMVPLAERNWTDSATAESIAQAPPPSSDGGEQAVQVDTNLALRVDENAWRPGSYMAMALERLLIMAGRVNATTDFGFDDKGSTVMAGFLTTEHPQKSSRPFEAGKTYAVIGAGSTGANIDVYVRDSSGNLIASDVAEDGNPTVTFTAATTDNYSIELTVVGQDQEFGAVVIMQDGGLRIEAEILQKVFQRLLDAGTFASAKVQEMGFPNGLVFHESDWAVQGTILYAGEAIRQRGIKLSGSTVFAAVSHEESLNIDLEVIDASSGQSWADNEPDSNPIVIVDTPDPNTTYDLRVIYGQGESATLATSLILRLSD
jgi:hypothetical protein